MSEPGTPAAPARTGHPDVDRALDALRGVVDKPLAEQPACYDEAHRALTEALELPADRRPVED
jgi:hypothetical protein